MANVVIVSRFGAKAGSTPGSYVREYVARPDATEPLTPYADRNDDIALDYDIRDLSDRLAREFVESEKALKTRDKRATPKASRLFGSHGLVYQETDYENWESRTRQAMEDGHVLIQPVISFDHEYLLKYRVFEEDLKRPDESLGEAYHGQVDQLKLRRAVTKGVNRLCELMYFKDPEWIAGIQVDTGNVHVHICLIETAPEKELDPKRFVLSPQMEWLEDEIDGEFGTETIYYQIPKLDDDGQPIHINLGERGRITERARQGAIRMISSELERLKEMSPYINDYSPHYQLPQIHEVHRQLSNQRVALDLMRIYESLPKGEAKETPQEKEAELIKAQETWQIGEDEIREAEGHIRSFCQRLLSNHVDALKSDGLYQEGGHLINQVALDTVDTDRSKERHELAQVITRTIEDRLGDQILKSLKSVRVIQTKEEAMYYRGREDVDVKEATLIGGQARVHLLEDEQLKSLIADTYADHLEGEGRTLAMAWRMRSYPERLAWAEGERDRANRALRQYEFLEDQGVLDKTHPSQAMKRLYQAQMEYYQGLMDKYHFLVRRPQDAALRYQGRYYSHPDGEDWGDWLRREGPRVTRQIESFDKDRPDIRESEQFLRKYEALPEALRYFSTKYETDDLTRRALMTREDYRDRAEFMVGIYDVYQKSLERGRQVSPARFEQVKGYDMMSMLYDFSPEVDREVSSSALVGYQVCLDNRYVALEDALKFLIDTNQSENLAYESYFSQFQHVQEEQELVSVLLDSGKLPTPLRLKDTRVEDWEALGSLRTLGEEDAEALVHEYLPELRVIVLDEEKKVRAVRKEHREYGLSQDEVLARLRMTSYQMLEEYQEELDRLEEERLEVLRERQRQAADLYEEPEDLLEAVSEIQRNIYQDRADINIQDLKTYLENRSLVEAASQQIRNEQKRVYDAPYAGVRYEID